MVSKAKSEAFTIRMLWSARTKTLYTYIHQFTTLSVCNFHTLSLLQP